MPALRKNYFGMWVDKRRLRFWRDVGRVRVRRHSAFVRNVARSFRVWGCGQKCFGRFVGRCDCSGRSDIAATAAKRQQGWMRDWVQMKRELPRD